MTSVISEIKKDFIYNLLLKGERIDGRSFDQYREISIERDVIRKAEGSALVKLGSSQVLVGALPHRRSRRKGSRAGSARRNTPG